MLIGEPYQNVLIVKPPYLVRTNRPDAYEGIPNLLHLWDLRELAYHGIREGLCKDNYFIIKKETTSRSLFQNGSQFAGIIGGLSLAVTLKNDIFSARGEIRSWF